MSNYKQQLHDIASIPKDIKIALVIAEFNKKYTSKLEELSREYFKEQWFCNVETFNVPWAIEIPWMAKRILDLDIYSLIINLWVVIRWETPHFDYVCSESVRWLLNLSLTYSTPLINGIITCNNEEQVEQRITAQYAISWLNLLAECNRLKSRK